MTFLGLLSNALKAIHFYADVRSRTQFRYAGFLDGGDRTVDAPPFVCASAPTEAEEVSSERAFPDPPRLPSGSYTLPVSTSVTCALLIMNLPSLLFSNDSDLKPLLVPFGHITDLKIHPLTSLNAGSGHVTVAVQYATVDSAYDAKIALHGQVYANHVLQAQFIQSPVSPSRHIIAAGPHAQVQDSYMLSNIPFSSNAQLALHHDVRYPYKTQDLSMHHRGLPMNANHSDTAFYSPFVHECQQATAAPWLVDITSTKLLCLRVADLSSHAFLGLAATILKTALLAMSNCLHFMLSLLKLPTCPIPAASRNLIFSVL